MSQKKATVFISSTMSSMRLMHFSSSVRRSDLLEQLQLVGN